MSGYKKILVPLDGSRFAQCVLPQVTAIALGMNVLEVIVLRVVEPLPDEVRNALVELGGEQIPGLEEKLKMDALDYTSGIEKMLCEEGLHVRSEVLLGKAPEEIMKYAEKNKVDLIIMSTHGRSGVSTWTMGSVAERVCNHSTVPVQLVSVKECRTSAGF